METLAELVARLKRQAADDDDQIAIRAMDAIDHLQKAADEARWIAAGLADCHRKVWPSSN